jgi:CheY-like chemotaxis protein
VATGGLTEAGDPGSSRRRILLVDDDADVRRAIAGLLEDEGYEVDACSDGQGAWERLHAAPAPDLMILDLMLPGMDGWQLRTRQRADPQLRHIPVLAISADPSPKASAIHADAFLAKPVGASVLLAEVERILQGRPDAAAAATGQLAELHRLALLGTLTANIEHQLRNPLAFLLTNARLAAESLPELKSVVAAGAPAPPRALDDMAGMVEDARAGAERIHAIVEAMGMIARGPGGPTARAVLDSVLEAAVHLCSGHLRRHVSVSRGVASGLEVRGDETELLQVLVCLLLTQLEQGGRNVRVDFHITVLRPAERTVWLDLEAVPRPELTSPVLLARPPGVPPVRPADAALGLALCRTLLARWGGAVHNRGEALVRLELEIADAEHDPGPAGGSADH